MPIYKNLPKERQKAKALPFYRPVDRVFIYLWEKRRSLAPFLAAGAVLLLIYSGLRVYANAGERRADGLYETGNLEEAVHRFPHSRAAVLSRMKLGGKSLEGGRYDEAISWYRPVASESVRPPVLRIAALQNLALAYVKKGDWANAVAFLERAIADRENASADYSRLLLAKTLEMEGEKAKAEEIYKSLSEGTEAGGIQQEAKEKLTWLQGQEKK